jgi:amino acid transporter
MFVTLGAIMAIMTALNGTMLVPSRLAMLLAIDKLAPKWLGIVNEKTATPIRGLTLTLLACAALLVSGQMSLALNVAVFALVVLYFVHSLVFLLLPRFNPQLRSEIKLQMPDWLLRASAIVSVVSMGVLIIIQVLRDIDTLRNETLKERILNQSVTSIELLVVWGMLSAAMYALTRRGAA